MRGVILELDDYGMTKAIADEIAMFFYTSLEDLNKLRERRKTRDC